MGASSSKSSSKPKDMTPQAFKDLQQPFADVVGQLLGQLGDSTMGGDIANGYQGQTVAPITKNETSTLAQLQGQTSNANAVDTTALQNAAQEGSSSAAAAQAVKALGIGADPNNPLLKAYIEAAQRPTQQALEETLSRTLPGRFTAAGQKVQPNSSSAFDRAAAIATRGTADALGDIATKISYQDYDAGQNRTMTAQQAALDRGQSATTAQQQIQTAEVDNTVKNLQAQALPRLIQDLGIERGMDVFNNKVNSLLGTLGVAAGTTRPVISSSSSSSSGGFNLK